MAVAATAAPSTAGLPVSPVRQFPATQPLPGLQCLGAPHPYTTGDAYHQRHEDLQHEHSHRGHGRFQTAVLVPSAWKGCALAFQTSEFPVVHIEAFVEVADDDACRRNGVKNGVDANLDH